MRGEKESERERDRVGERKSTLELSPARHDLLFCSDTFRAHIFFFFFFVVWALLLALSDKSLFYKKKSKREE